MKNALFKWRHFLIPFHFTSFTLPHISTPNYTKSIVPLPLIFRGPHFLSRFHFPAATPELSINFLFTHSLPAEALVLMPTVPRFHYCCPRVTTANFVSDSDTDSESKCGFGALGYVVQLQRSENGMKAQAVSCNFDFECFSSPTVNWI